MAYTTLKIKWYNLYIGRPVARVEDGRYIPNYVREISNAAALNDAELNEALEILPLKKEIIEFICQ
jgi:hypothetical protein